MYSQNAGGGKRESCHVCFEKFSTVDRDVRGPLLLNAIFETKQGKHRDIQQFGDIFY